MGVTLAFDAPRAMASMDPVMILPPAKSTLKVTPVSAVIPLKINQPPQPVRKPGSKGKDVASVQIALPGEPSAQKETTIAYTILKAISSGNAAGALGLLNAPSAARNMSVADYDRLRVKIAASFLTKGEMAKALDLARASLRRSGSAAPMAGWVAGLSAWRMGDYKASLSAFTVTASNDKAETWLRAGAAFWASRAAGKIGNKVQEQSFRNLASQFDRTFYGQLALAQMGRDAGLSWAQPAPADEAVKRLRANEYGRQAMDHIAAGRLSAADQAIQKVNYAGDPALRLAALSFAMRSGLAASALRLAPMVERETGVRYDAAYYPLGGWVADQDFRVDRALVHAIIRQESKFDPEARSHQGAVGLMQLLPSTAAYVVKVKAGGKMGAVDLNRSVQNLDLGQHYLEYLLAHPAVKGDMVHMLIAYNAGPGNLSKWQKQFADVDDPLLFMEVIPSAETRLYVEKVMASYWIYRNRLGMPNPTLAALAAGQDASYAKATRPWFAGFNLETALARP